MIQPTVGRVVLIRRPHIHTSAKDQPECGLITYVHSERMINVVGFTWDGAPFALTSLRLKQEGDEVPVGAQHAEWMPYQKGQAAKTEALEKQLSGA